MARSGGPRPRTTLYRHNIRLESFLKRNTERALYERIRAYEPCVVKSDSINKIYMHVVMSDDRVYLTEFPPRTLTSAFSFSSVRAIDLINDLPEFLSGKDRLRCQHIKIIYVPEKSTSEGQSFQQRNEQLFPALSSSHAFSPLTTEEPATQSSPMHTLRPTRSVSCPNGETLGLLVPHPPARPHSSASMYPNLSDQHAKNTQSPKVSRRYRSLFSRLLKRNKEPDVAELHLYALSPVSTLYLHLQSIWISFNIRSTLTLDPLYRSRYCSSPCNSPGNYFKVISWEQTVHLFFQLKTELLQEAISVENLYLLLQELCTAAHRDITIRRLFWRSSELCLSLVQALERCLLADQSQIYTTDQLLMRTVLVQTLAVMFRETEVEPARLSLLSANNGVLVAKMLLALICDAQAPNDTEIKSFLTEYLDTACSLLFELIILGHEKSWFSSTGCILSIGWMFQVLQSHRHLFSFIGYQTQQVVMALSRSHHYIMTPVQSVLLFQRCRLLLVCLQYSNYLSRYLKSNFREDFKYTVNASCAETKLPPHHPICPTIQCLVEQIRTLILV